MKKQCAVARVFGIDIDLPGKNGGAHNIGRAQLKLVLDGKTAGLEQLDDHVAEQRAFGVDLRRHDNSALSRPRRRAEREQAEDQGGDGGCQPSEPLSTE